MASNAKTRKRSKTNKTKADSKFGKLLCDIDKVLSTGDLPSHYVGGGQAFTRGNTKSTKSI